MSENYVKKLVPNPGFLSHSNPEHVEFHRVLEEWKRLTALRLGLSPDNRDFLSIAAGKIIKKLYSENTNQPEEVFF